MLQSDARQVSKRVGEITRSVIYVFERQYASAGREYHSKLTPPLLT